MNRKALWLALSLSLPLGAAIATVSTFAMADAPPAAQARAAAAAPTVVDGRFQRYLVSPRGETMGLLLDGGTVVRIHPDAATKGAPELKAGDAVHVEGRAIKTPTGQVVMHALVKRGSDVIADGTAIKDHAKGDHKKGDHKKGDHKKGEHDKAALAPLTSTGKIVAIVTGHRGKVAGVILDDGTTIAADAVVIAAGSWSSLIGETSLAADAVQPARGQMIELHVDAPIVRGVIEAADCYLSPRDDGRLLVGSTIELVGFRGGATASGVRDLLAAALRLVPALQDATVTRAWAGFRPKTHDDMPLIGTVGIEGLVIATGHFRNGVLLAPITGEIVAALLTGGALPVDIAPFAPRRARATASAAV